MRVKRCTRVLIAAFLVLISCSFILDQPGIFAASLSFWVFIVIRYFLFFSRVASTVASVQIIRSVDKPIVLQGSTCKVTTMLSLFIQEGISVTYTELIPSGVKKKTGETMTPEIRSGKIEQALEYQITPLMHGTILLPGGSLTMHDWFFENTILLSGKPFSGPALHVQPSPLFVVNSKTFVFGRNEKDLKRFSYGPTIRTYRKYEQTDDIKQIDWKLSAKHNTLYVREYSTLINSPPFIIIDLPDNDKKINEEDFSEIVRGVATLIQKTLKGGVNISLLLISGPNIIGSILDEHDVNRFMAVIRDLLHPHTRIHHFYRVHSRIEIRKNQKIIQGAGKENTDNNISRFLSRINGIYQNHLQDGGVNRYSTQISRALGSVRILDISLYSLCDGDVSHIVEIAHQARIRKIRFSIKTPSGTDVFRINPQCSSLQGEIIEGIV